METDCAAARFPGWENLPLQKGVYSVSKANGATREGQVIMLNPSSLQLAQWIMSACAEIELDNERCRMRLFDHILNASGGQFVIAGVVWEDISPADGVYEGYTFRNGVTVLLEGVPNAATRVLTETERNAAIAPETPVLQVRRYARIASTSPDDYRANGGAVDVGTTASPSLAWHETVGALYRAAWVQDQNELITAWARTHKTELE